MTISNATIVFPGQGTQRTGMGRDFHEQFESARRTFEEVADALSVDVASLCFHDAERLGQTQYAQPAILTTEVAMLRSIEQEFGLTPSYFGGHSLGEYTALVAAGALPLADAARLVRERGRLMQEAVPAGVGRMSAVIGESLDRQVIGEALEGLQVGIANDNASTQVVLSGMAGDTLTAEHKIEDAVGTDGVRFVELDVSAPFHSPLMAVIEPAFERALRSIGGRLNAARAALVTSNFAGGFHDTDAEMLIQRLVRQISGTVRWRDNMETLVRRCGRVIEIGPGRPLRGFFKSIGVEVHAITDVRSALRVGEALALA